jgi:hypothetical protein
MDKVDEVRLGFLPSTDRCPADIGRVETRYPVIREGGAIEYVCGFSGVSMGAENNSGCRWCIRHEYYKNKLDKLRE